MMKLKRIGFVSCVLLWTALSGQSQVVINEIMYHPSSENVLEEYIELRNRAGTNVNLGGWRISNGVQFTFPSNTVIAANGYLVVAAHRQTFTNKYSGVLNVVGDWVGILSNSRNDIDLDDANGDRVDSVEYADEGDWAIRQRGPMDRGGFRGWIWYKEHDGLGKSLELINPALPNEHGQNWAASAVLEGTPGFPNSVLATNIAPMILEVQHFPVVPTSTQVVTVSARLIDEATNGLSATLRWRLSTASPGPFTPEPMFDDGAHGDGAANDGIWGATIPAFTNNAVIEFYVEATDSSSNARTWPAPAIGSPDGGVGPTGQVANALYQVDDNPQNTYGGTPSQQPVYKVIMTENEREELRLIPGQSNQHAPNSQMNATFISIDASGASRHYLVGVRNRGHASRTANPPNYRVNFRSDDRWQDVTAVNLNSQQVHIQHFGSMLANKSGSAGNYSKAVQLRINNLNRAQSGSPMFGSYAANEVYNSEWAERHFPNDSGGNVYKMVRDWGPPEFDYRIESAYPSGFYGAPSPQPNNFINFGPEDKRTYTNTFYKETNVSEDDWTDLIGMVRVMGTNGITEFTESTVRQVINVEAWLTHLAVMCLMGNHESGLNDGHNDDYYMYRGISDPRFILMHHDLDQILGFGGSHPSNDGLFGMTSYPPRGSGDIGGVGRMMQRFLGTNYPSDNPGVFRRQYLQTLQRLLDTTFSQPQFDSLVDSTLGSYVPVGTINQLKSWMSQRRSHVLGLIAGNPAPGVATISGEPRSPTPSRSASLIVGGTDIVAYRFKLNNGSYGGERPIGSNIVFNNTLPNNSTNTIYVIGRNSQGAWQSQLTPTVSKTWVVNTSWPAVRINEVLARNVAAVNHNGTFPDIIELHNEGGSAIDLSGMRLTDDPTQPDKYTFPAGTSLAAGGYLALYANNDDGTPGIHLGFSLNDAGEGVYLYHRIANGGALLDSVEFGTQLPDLSIGRVNGNSSGTWVLCAPTAGAANVAQAVSEQRAVKINEWLTLPQAPFAEDFIELFNPGAAPVDIGGLYLTDAPAGAPTRHRIRDLTFVPGGGFYVFTADGQEDEVDHVNFQLSSDVGEIALVGPGSQIIDCVSYGPQRAGGSMGRCPDGSITNRLLTVPTPGSPNLCPAPPPGAQTVTLLNFSNSWRFEQSGFNQGTVWREPGFDDSGWPFGPGLLAAMRPNGTLPEPVRTPLMVNNTKTTFYFRAYFSLPSNVQFTGFQMTHVIDDGAVVYVNGNEAARYNMPPPPAVILNTTLASGNITDATYVGPVSLSPTNFVPGTNVIAVEVHQGNAGSADIVLGMLLEGVIITNTAEQAGVMINEVLANNGSLADPDGSTPDWVEFYNPSDSAVDLAGMSVSDSTLDPDRFVFPAGSILPGRGYFVMRFDADKPPSPTNTGFGLKASGDTLYLLSQNNSILDTVTFGFQAPDFSIGRQAGVWRLCIPTLGTTNLAAVLGDPRQVRINEWMADPVSGNDWFELYNPGQQPVALGLCWLTDDLGTRQKHQLWPLSFIGAVTSAWQRITCDPDPAGDHVSFNLRASAPGESLGLSLPDGVPIDSISFGAQATGVSQGRLLDGESTIVSFPGTPSPSDPNYVLMNNVVISEVLTHSDSPVEDAIEIQNIGASAVNVSGWWLSDSRGAPQKFQIPTVPPIPAGGFRVFYENQFNDPDAAAIPFALSSGNGDEVYLSAATNSALTGARAQAEFGPAENRVSFGRYRTSQGFDFTAMSRHTFGVDMPATVSQFRTGGGLSNAYPKIGPVVITELMYHPPAAGTNENVTEEFIELHNPGGSPAPLYDPARATNTWRLRGGADFDFLPGTTIAPGGYLLVVSFNPSNNPSALATFRARYGTNSVLTGPYAGRLDNGGEDVRLLKPDPPNTNNAGKVEVPYVLVDYVAYSDRAPWPTNADGFGASLQRVHALGYANDPTNWLAAAPTPGPAGLPDSDGDGLPDWWEQMFFSSPTAALPNEDSDGDGMTNLQEYHAGTHPRSSGSVLRINRHSVTRTGNTVMFQFSGISNKTYTVQYSTSLEGNDWHFVASVPTANTNGARTVTDNGAVNGQRFYRVVTP